MKRYSIQRRIILRTLIGISVVFLVAMFIVDRLIVDWLSNEYDNNLLSKARVLITLTKEYEHETELDFADEIMPEFEREENPEYFQLWTENGEIFEKSHSLGNEEFAKSDYTEIGVQFYDQKLIDGREGRAVTVNFFPQIDDKSLRTKARIANQKKMSITVAKETSSLYSVIAMVNSLLFLGSLITITILFLVIHFSVKEGLKPLISIAQQLQQFNTQALDERLILPVEPVEIVGVINQFNELMEKLEKGFNREKQFSSDVAHELRTPIAEIRNIAEIAIKWPEDVSLKQSMSKDILDASLQMTSIINDLLALARCENGTSELHKQEINFVERINMAWSRYEKEAVAKDLSIVSEFSGSPTIISSAVEVDLVLNNVFSNAIDYSPNGSDINVKFENDNGLFKFCLSNTAIHLEKEDLKTIFDRLWRKDKSRTSESHSGLGLSLVKAYSKILGLNLAVNLSDNKLFTFSLSNKSSSI